MDNYVGELPAILGIFFTGLFIPIDHKYFLDLEYNNLHSYVSNKDSSAASPWCTHRSCGIIERTNIEFQFIQ